MESEKLYEKYNDGRHWERHPTVYAETFVNFLKENNFNGQIVDTGCGDGRDVNVFSQAGFDVLGIDNSEKEITVARKKFPKLNFEVQNAEQLSFKDNSVGAFFMINVIHYLKKEEAIAEVYRTLKPGGYFSVHFNMEIRDKSGNIDYQHNQEEIMQLVSNFNIIRENIFIRTDQKPVEHRHKIVELVLQKTG